MAQMTRDDFVTALQARGWNRFIATDLQRYLDWGLRDIVRAVNFKDEQQAVSLAAQSVSPIAFSSINSGLVQTIDKVINVTANYENELDPLPSEEFYEFWLPNPDREIGVPDWYYVYEKKLYLIPYPQQAFDFVIHITGRINGFAGGSSTSGLPEYFDEAILPSAESYCFRRAHETDRMAVAQAEVRRILLDQLAADGMQSSEEEDRVIPYR